MTLRLDVFADGNVCATDEAAASSLAALHCRALWYFFFQLKVGKDGVKPNTSVVPKVDLCNRINLRFHTMVRKPLKNCVKLDFRSVVTTHPAGLIIGVLRLLALCRRFSLCVRKKSAQ